MTDEVKQFGTDCFIDEFVSGGPKNYAIFIRSNSSDFHKTVCKVRGITVNSSTVDTVSFNNLKEIVLNDAPPIKLTYKRRIKRKVPCKVVSGTETKTFRVVYNKRRRVNNFDIVPYRNRFKSYHLAAIALPTDIHGKPHYVAKGYFPHSFNTRENSGYISPPPSTDFYGLDSISTKERTDFLKWHGNLRGSNYVFNMSIEIIEYCVQDVNILRLEEEVSPSKKKKKLLAVIGVRREASPEREEVDGVTSTDEDIPSWEAQPVEFLFSPPRPPPIPLSPPLVILLDE
ncbi:hypothetical protein J437_LFUL013230 [Ladona fulva]|uniref:Uncharacterized protein n=1 Tax=Ladona fulva TaxID=123851 RepID=A0A8K0K6W5_LADFU|nr:hypothetical protein J437_LFUL013230 [Ladona fulva]